MTAILKMCDLSRGRGWENTIKKLIDENKDKSEEIDNLYEHYCDYLLVGEKAVKFFRFNQNKLDRLISGLKSYTVKNTEFHQYYPFPLSEEELKDIDPLPKLVEIKKLKNSLAIIFCTKRTISERSKISTKELSSASKKDLGSYDELIGIKRYTRQFFDIIIIWENIDLIEVRVDITGEMTSKERARSFIQIIKQFNELAKNNFGIQTALKENINFFPLIDKFYESNEGKVGELAFTTDEGSIKFEKMRKGEVDLRNETYHRAGRQAVDHITPYRLAILWIFEFSEDVKTQPELLFPGQARNLSDENQNLGEVIIKNCSNLKDYKFVLEKIINYLDSCG
ncbi:MAG: hypothetical protein SWY16_19190 [Cyanobacteriota bacterium]|nr:hypothetical protein [Cyanobacteriota bacterium]